ncbi:hypothetical protein DVJ83_15275 (plasmid) [Deinococcus wulumuqiensis]|uniref:Uncharacterized protein n=1 Tax=Deinococcus wulumuqiensis TaxID=980427 RepID=A0A345ILG6_9DEIO|nr:hypothetical protein DVJ83_15275 [Deinococcus wulumuqiensis]
MLAWVALIGDIDPIHHFFCFTLTAPLLSFPFLAAVASFFFQVPADLFLSISIKPSNGADYTGKNRFSLS